MNDMLNSIARLPTYTWENRTRILQNSKQLKYTETYQNLTTNLVQPKHLVAISKGSEDEKMTALHSIRNPPVLTKLTDQEKIEKLYINEKQVTVGAGTKIQPSEIGLYVSSEPGCGFLGASPTKLVWLKQQAIETGFPSLTPNTQCVLLEIKICEKLPEQMTESERLEIIGLLGIAVQTHCDVYYYCPSKNVGKVFGVDCDKEKYGEMVAKAKEFYLAYFI